MLNTQKRLAGRLISKNRFFVFLKPASSLIPNQGEIILPSSDLTSQVEMEGEVALVIGKRGKKNIKEEALDYVFGCTIFNDVTARDLTKS
ncbi:hypothetical protein GCM10020331_020580 [Ectobacillus funiculus]